MEVLQTCEKYAKTGQTDYSLHTVSLWDYARKKVQFPITYCTVEKQDTIYFFSKMSQVYYFLKELWSEGWIKNYIQWFYLVDIALRA